MDPNYFYLNYEKLIEILITIVVLSLIIERALSILFESRFFIERTESGEVLSEMKKARGEKVDEKILEKKKRPGVKELISFIISVAVCAIWKFDALTILFVTSENMTFPGYILTGSIIAGGSKGSIALFKDVLRFMSSAEKERIAAKNKNGKK